MQSIIITALITTGLCVTGITAFGQTFSEWWLQKKTRIKYLHKQIAVLEELKAIIENGYQQAEDEVDSIGEISVEQMGMHEQYLKSLKLVKPAFKDWPELVSSRALAADLLRRVIEALERYTQEPAFTEEDVRWLNAETTQILTSVGDDLKELDALTSEGVFTMTDSEREDEIWATAINIRHKYEAAMRFLAQINIILEGKRRLN